MKLQHKCLNPFRTGRCLSTVVFNKDKWKYDVSIPFEQGDVFRLMKKGNHVVSRSLNPFRTGRCLSTIAPAVTEEEVKSQSLSNRAMSFDTMKLLFLMKNVKSQSLSIRAMSFDQMLKNRVRRATESQSLSIRAMSFDYHFSSRYYP